MPDGSAERAALRVEVERVDADEAVVALAGRFDAVEAPPVRRVLDDPAIRAAASLTIDLRDVTFIDSAGLAVLARARRDRVLRGDRITLVRPHLEEAMRVFRLTQFDEIFHMVAQRGEEGR